MTQTIILAKNSLDPATWTTHHVDDLLELLQQELGTWPKTARVYHGQVCQANDITPKDAQSAAKLKDLQATDDKPLFVVVMPEDPITIIAAVVAVVAIVAAAFLFPKIPNIGNTSASSSNNSLSSRSNDARLNGRIPDIFGRVRAYPDLLTSPYTYYQNNSQVEVSYMCVGRGSYELADVRDGRTRLIEIAGAAAEFYAPFTSPNSVAPTPQLTIGDSINLPVLAIAKMNEVNGQTLFPPNSRTAQGDGDIRFVYPDTIQLSPSSTSEIDFSDLFDVGQQITVSQASFAAGDPGLDTLTTNAKFTYSGTIVFETVDPSTFVVVGSLITIPQGLFVGETSTGDIQYVNLSGTYYVDAVTSTTITVNTPTLVTTDWDLLDGFTDDETTYRSFSFTTPTIGTGSGDLAGTYTIVAVSADQISLSNPSIINAAWSNLDDLPDGSTEYMDAIISSTGENWVGPFTASLKNADRMLINLVAKQGAYQVSKKNKQSALTISAEIEITPVDDNGDPTGAAVTQVLSVEGSKESKDSLGSSIWINDELPISDAYKIRMRRSTLHNYEYDGTIVDEIQWESAYIASKAPEEHFGDVTTVMTKTFATEGALAVKQRKFSVLATRKLPIWQPGTETFSSTLQPTLRVSDMIIAAALDPKIGNRQQWEVDIQGIHDIVDEVEEYFGTSEAIQFCYTFDQLDMSFEETIQAMAQASFCVAYRQGSIISLRFEKPEPDSVLLLNHRNKQPDTETRTVTFGISEGFDGVSLEYIDPTDDVPVTIFVPQGDGSGVKVKKIETLGVRSDVQAHLQAWRAWNKLKYQHEALEVVAEEEADLLVLADRVLVADNTRSDTQDGEVISQTGLMLELSQNVDMLEDEDYVIFLQLSDGTTQRIDITPGVHSDEVILAEAPLLPLVLDDTKFARTTYIVASSAGSRTAQPFLLTEKTPLEGGRYELRAINYDVRYYNNDKDHIDGFV